MCIVRSDINGKLPVIMDVHGGGWVYGDKMAINGTGMNEHSGFTVVNYFIA